VTDYPLAPVAQYAGMVNSTIAALEYLATHGPPGCENGASEAPPLLIGGDSAGGGLAYSVLISISSGKRTLHGGAVSLSGGFFFSPWTNMRCDTPSYLNNAFSMIKRAKGGVAYAGDVLHQDTPAKNVVDSLENAVNYLGDRKLLDDPIASPILAGADLLSNMPPVLFVVAAHELIFGDAVIAAQNAAAASVEVVLDVYEGMWHDFPMYSEGCGNPWKRQLWQGVDAIARAAAFMKHFAGESPQRGAAEAQQNGGTQTTGWLAAVQDWWTAEEPCHHTRLGEPYTGVHYMRPRHGREPSGILSDCIMRSAYFQVPRRVLALAILSLLLNLVFLAGCWYRHCGGSTSYRVCRMLQGQSQSAGSKEAPINDYIKLTD